MCYKKIFFYIQKIEKLYENYYDTKTIKQFDCSQITQKILEILELRKIENTFINKSPTRKNIFALK